MNVVILFWTRDTATPKLDRHLGAAEKHALPFLMTNATGWLYCVPFYFMGQRAGLLNWQDVLAIVVYVLGTVIHFTADLQKKRFKAKPEMKGLGSTRVSGATAATRTISATCSSTLAGRCSPRILSPGTNLAQYAFDAIPKNEEWAADRNGQAWTDYAARTSRLMLWPPHRPEATSDDYTEPR